MEGSHDWYLAESFYSGTTRLLEGCELRAKSKASNVFVFRETHVDMDSVSILVLPPPAPPRWQQRAANLDHLPTTRFRTWDEAL